MKKRVIVPTKSNDDNSCEQSRYDFLDTPASSIKKSQTGDNTPQQSRKRFQVPSNADQGISKLDSMFSAASENESNLIQDPIQNLNDQSQEKSENDIFNHNAKISKNPTQQSPPDSDKEDNNEETKEATEEEHQDPKNEKLEEKNEDKDDFQLEKKSRVKRHDPLMNNYTEVGKTRNLKPKKPQDPLGDDPFSSETTSQQNESNPKEQSKPLKSREHYKKKYNTKATKKEENKVENEEVKKRRLSNQPKKRMKRTSAQVFKDKIEKEEQKASKKKGKPQIIRNRKAMKTASNIIAFTGYDSKDSLPLKKIIINLGGDYDIYDDSQGQIPMSKATAFSILIIKGTARTIKVLYALSTGHIPIVTEEYLLKAKEQGDWDVTPEQYQTAFFKKVEQRTSMQVLIPFQFLSDSLFKGFNFYISGPLDKNIDNDTIRKLIRLNGGKVTHHFSDADTMIIEYIPSGMTEAEEEVDFSSGDDHDDKSDFEEHTQNQQESQVEKKFAKGVKKAIQQSSRRRSARLNHKVQTVKFNDADIRYLTSKWVFDCIMDRKLHPFSKYKPDQTFQRQSLDTFE